MDEQITHKKVCKTIMKYYNNRISRPPLLTMYRSNKDDSTSEYNSESSSKSVDHDKLMKKASQQLQRTKRRNKKAAQQRSTMKWWDSTNKNKPDRKWWEPVKKSRKTDYLDPHDTPPIPTVKLTSNDVKRDLSKSYPTPDDQNKTQHPSLPDTHDQGAESNTKQPPSGGGSNDSALETGPRHYDDSVEANIDLTRDKPEHPDNISPNSRTPHSPHDENAQHDNEAVHEGDDMITSKRSGSDESSLSPSDISNTGHTNQFSWN